jgi:hypothetical protein
MEPCTPDAARFVERSCAAREAQMEEQQDVLHREPLAEHSLKLLVELPWRERVQPEVVPPGAPESSQLKMKPVTTLPEAQRPAQEQLEPLVAESRAPSGTPLPASQPEAQPPPASLPEYAQRAALPDAARLAPQLPCAA